jgi:arylsulfatase A-like enzyme
MPEPNRPPNLLFVFADQMRGMDMRCAGNSQMRTPTLDRLAAEGLRLTHCFATSPVCGPNRAALLSGQLPTTTGVVGNDLPMPIGIPSLGAVLAAAGYRTGYIGKWHLDGIPRSKFTPPGPRRHGFDFWAAYNCSHDYFHPRYYRDSPELIETEGYEPVIQTDLALEYLQTQPADRPFCLLLSWGPPHDPYDQVPEEYRRLYDPTTLELRANVRPEADNPLATGMECRRATADYYAAITALDSQLARLLNHLETTGKEKDTVVIFTSDHGDMLWSHGCLKKQTPYEESIHVPFLMRWPGYVQAGSVRSTLTGTVDLLPTLLGVLGIDPPIGLFGRDLAEHWIEFPSKPAQTPPEALFIANYFVSDEAVQQAMPEWRGVRTARYTYAERVGRLPWLLFDNLADPYQEHNLVGDPSNAQVEEMLRQALSACLARAEDPFLPEQQMVDHLGLTEAWKQRQISVF